MNNITNKINLLKIQTENNFNNSKAKNTQRAYKSDIADFCLFCSKHNFNFMPSKPEIISLYLTYMSNTYKFSTIKRRLASIKIFHRLKGHHIDLQHPVINENLSGIKRKIGSYQKGKKPISINILNNIINFIDSKNVNNNLLYLRDKSLLLIGFSGGFRRSELVSLKKNDLEFVDEGLKIFIKKSKNDQFGEGLVKAIPYFKNKNCCPVENTKTWIKNIKENEDLIFPISDKMVSLIIKKYLNLLDMDSSLYSGHSLRSGFATSTASYGADERSIMSMTGHKSVEMVRRYIKDANLFKNNALNKLNNL